MTDTPRAMLLNVAGSLFFWLIGNHKGCSKYDWQHIISEIPQELLVGIYSLSTGGTARHYDTLSALSKGRRIFNVRVQMMAHQFCFGG